MKTATESMLRIDLRRNRAQQFTAMVMNTIAQHVDDREQMRCIHDDLFKLMHDHGVEVLTDAARHEAGLPARGPDGWTAEELIALEKKRLEMLSRPLSPIFVDNGGK